MGFSDHFVHHHNASGDSHRAAAETVVHKSQKDLVSDSDDARRLPDQEILDSTDEIYFQENVNCEEYELRVRVRG